LENSRDFSTTSFAKRKTQENRKQTKAFTMVCVYQWLPKTVKDMIDQEDNTSRRENFTFFYLFN